MEINGKQNQVEKINILGLESDDFQLFGKTLGEFLQSGRSVTYYSKINDIWINTIRVQVYRKDWITITLKDVPTDGFKVYKHRNGCDVVQITDPAKFQQGIVVNFTRG